MVEIVLYIDFVNGTLDVSWFDMTIEIDIYPLL